jgi:imidazolonepropionase-like amidohydrolase
VDYRTDGPSFALTDVVVFDGEQVVDADTVLVRDGLIAAVGRGLAVPDDLPRRDGRGRVLLPGLIDAHSHAADHYANAALRFGVTTLLEMHGGPVKGEKAAREDLSRDDAADVWTAGQMITVPGGHGTQWGGDPPVITPDTDIGAFVDDRLDEGSDFIKLVIDELEGTYQTLTPDQVAAVVRAAHDRDRIAVAHIGTWKDAEVAVDAGIDALVHAPYDAPVNQRLIHRLAERPIPIVATLVVYSAISGVHAGSDYLNRPNVARYLDQDQRAAAQLGWSALWPTWFEDAVEGVSAMYEAGVPILAGTDFGNPGTVPGVSLIHEMKLLKQAGLSDADTLAAATSRGAKLLNLTDRGRIATGNRADLVLMNSPTISETIGSYDTTAIWRNGHHVARKPADQHR